MAGTPDWLLSLRAKVGQAISSQRTICCYDTAYPDFARRDVMLEPTTHPTMIPTITPPMILSLPAWKSAFIHHPAGQFIAAM
jgi:hypothetical protein